MNILIIRKTSLNPINWICRFIVRNTIKTTPKITNIKEPINTGDKIRFKFALKIIQRKVTALLEGEGN